MLSSPITVPTLRQLELFLAAAKYGSFAHASEAIFVTPNAVSSAVNELETLLNTQLFIRRRAKGLTLTTSGRHLVEHAQRLIQQAQELTLTISNRADEEPSGPVRVGCYATLAATIVPKLWAQIAQDLPNIQLDIEEGTAEDLSTSLLEGHLDMLISYRVGLPSGLISAELFETRPHVSLPEQHALSQHPKVSLHELANEPLVLLDLPPSGDNTLRLLQEQGLSPTVIHRSSSYETVRSMVARGFGYSLFFQQTYAEWSYEGLRVVDREIDPPLAAEPVVLSYDRAVGPTYRAAAVRNLILAMFQPGILTE